jgi:translation initiation factor IF-3
VRRARRKTSVPPRPRVSARVNEQIGAPNLRVVDDEGGQVGVMTRADALAHAESVGLDLVEIAADADPPVCRLIDYGRWRFDEERRLRTAQRNQQHGGPKEVRLRPRISTHDYAWKRDQALEFLRGRDSVKVVVFFRGREREHPEAGRKLLARLAEDVRDVGQMQGRESFEGRTMTVILAPNGATG